MTALAIALVLAFGQVTVPAGPVDLHAPPVQHPAVNGSIEFKENQRIVNLWGTHYEMGYAHGMLLGDEIMELVEEYGLQVMIDPALYGSVVLPLVQYAYTVDARFDEELDGMLDGMTDSGTDLFVDLLGRDLTWWDLFAVNLCADLGQLACSATFGWGTATAADPTLAGGSALVRDLDWGLDPTGFLNTQAVIITFDSSLPDEKPIISLSWPGLISVLTAYSEDGVAAMINYGNHQGYGTPQPKHYTGIGFSLRSGLERRDVNGDGYENHFDVSHAVASVNTLASFDVSLLSPYPVPGAPGAGAGSVLEVNYYGLALRDSSNNMDFTPYLNASDLLAVTNHHRLLYTPVYCARYSFQVTQLSIDYAVDTEELWDMESAISWAGTHQMACFRPNLMDMLVAFNETFNGAAHSNRVHYTWAELFPNH